MQEETALRVAYSGIPIKEAFSVPEIMDSRIYWTKQMTKLTDNLIQESDEQQPCHF